MLAAVWVLAAAIAAQSLGEVAERERERRARNAEAGVEAVSYTSHGGSITPETAKPSEEQPQKADEGETEASPIEAERERGEILEPQMAEIAGMADRVDDLYRRYMDQCYGRYAVGATPPGIGFPTQPPAAHVQMGRDWFLVLDTPSALTTPIPKGRGGSFILVETPQCQSLREELVAAASEVKRAMRELLDLARRERVLPGVVRELREKYRLEWNGWER